MMVFSGTSSIPEGANLQSSASLEVADKAWASESLFGSLGEWCASLCIVSRWCIPTVQLNRREC